MGNLPGRKAPTVRLIMKLGFAERIKGCLVSRAHSSCLYGQHGKSIFVSPSEALVVASQTSEKMLKTAFQDQGHERHGDLFILVLTLFWTQISHLGQMSHVM
jgi:hypothetical protein